MADPKVNNPNGDISDCKTDTNDVDMEELKICSFAKTFSKIVCGYLYVDKSLLIYKLFYQEFKAADGTTYKIHDKAPGVIINAPQCCGKTINLDMLKCFLEIQLDEETGKSIPRDDTRSNYKLFNGLKIMTPKYGSFVESYFGKFPVIKMNFLSCDKITNFTDAVIFCNKAIYNSFKEHKYLLNSEKLSEEEKDLFKKWVSDVHHVKMTKAQTTLALALLSKYLYQHFGSMKVFVLIDNYDSLTTKVKLQIGDIVIRHNVIQFYFSVLASLLKENNYVYGAVVAGTSYPFGMGLCDATDKLTIYSCSNKHRFVEYFGFTDDEVDEICNKLKAPDSERLRKPYETISDNPIIYSPISVLINLVK